MYLKKPRCPNGTVITMVSLKAGSRKGRVPEFGLIVFGTFLGEDCVQRCLSENPENRKWHLNPTFHKSSALGSSKNCPRERFWKNIKNLWKNNRKINGCWWSETIENYWKTNTFLVSWSFKKTMKNDAKRDLKSHVFWSKIEPIQP